MGNGAISGSTQGDVVQSMNQRDPVNREQSRSVSSPGKEGGHIGNHSANQRKLGGPEINALIERMSSLFKKVKPGKKISEREIVVHPKTPRPKSAGEIIRSLPKMSLPLNLDGMRASTEMPCANNKVVIDFILGVPNEPWPMTDVFNDFFCTKGSLAKPFSKVDVWYPDGVKQIARRLKKGTDVNLISQVGEYIARLIAYKCREKSDFCSVKISKEEIAKYARKSLKCVKSVLALCDETPFGKPVEYFSAPSKRALRPSIVSMMNRAMKDADDSDESKLESYVRREVEKFSRLPDDAN